MLTHERAGVSSVVYIRPACQCGWYMLYMDCCHRVSHSVCNGWAMTGEFGHIWSYDRLDTTCLSSQTVAKPQWLDRGGLVPDGNVESWVATISHFRVCKPVSRHRVITIASHRLYAHQSNFLSFARYLPVALHRCHHTVYCLVSL